MKHKAWSSIEEVPYCFSRSSVKFQGHKGSKIVDFDPNWGFPDCNSSLNSLMLWNDAKSLKWHRRGALLFFKVIHQISRSHGAKKGRFWPEFSVTDYNSNLNRPMAMKWCTKLEVAQKRYPIVFQGHPSNFKVTRDQKLPNLTQIEHFWMVTRFWIHW